MSRGSTSARRRTASAFLGISSVAHGRKGTPSGSERSTGRGQRTTAGWMFGDFMQDPLAGKCTGSRRRELDPIFWGLHVPQCDNHCRASSIDRLQARDHLSTRELLHPARFEADLRALLKTSREESHALSERDRTRTPLCGPATYTACGPPPRW